MVSQTSSSTEPSATLKAGVIGLGQLGSGVAICLARAGMLSSVFDVRADAATNLEGVPELEKTPAELARKSDVIIISVVNAPQIISVLTGEDGVLAGARAGSTILILSTIGVEHLKEVRALVQAKSIVLIDSPVIGAAQSATKGMILLVGATDEQLADVRPVMESFSKYIEHVGGPGAGATAKIIYNGIFISSLRAGFEGAALARAAGVSIQTLNQIFKDSIESVGPPTAWAARPNPIVDPEEMKNRVRQCPMSVKDLDAAIELGRLYDIPTPVFEYANKTFSPFFLGQEIVK